MKKRPSVGLVSAGKLTDSPVTRFRGLTDQLGPVKASSLRVSSRVVNTLRAGYAVEHWDELGYCRLIVISAPDEMVSELVAELAASSIPWHNKAVVLCSVWLDARALAPLARLGAAVGSIMPIPGFDGERYLVEGNTLVVREAHKLLGHRGARVLTVEPPLKPFFLAALNCTGSILYALIVAAADCLRQANIPHSETASLLEKELERTLRAYFSAGRKAFPTPRDLSSQLSALALVQPALAQYMEQTANAAIRLLSNTRRGAAAGSSSTS